MKLLIRLIAPLLIAAPLAAHPGHDPVTLQQSPSKDSVQEILYIRGSFTDKKMPLSDKEWTKRIETMHASLVKYWKLHSYGKITGINPTITDPLTLDGTAEDFFKYTKLASGMQKAATKAGHKVKDFKHVVYLYPGIKHDISFGGLGGGGQIWLPGAKPFDGGLIHEFGHSLGLGHAHSVEGAYGTIYPGETRSGRDGLHMMGSDGNQRNGFFATINLPMRYQLGYVGNEHLEKITKSGVYRILDYETEFLPSEGKVGLRLSIKDEDFWVSFGPKMADKWKSFPAQNYAKGVMVHRRKGAETYLLDFTPGSIGKTKNEEDYIDTRDGALPLGQSFVFPQTTIGIKPISVGKSSNGTAYIDVKVSFQASSLGFQDLLIGTATGSTTSSGDTIVIKTRTKAFTQKGEHLFFHAAPSEGEKDGIQATIGSFLGASSTSRAGVMMRAGEGAGAAHASILLAGDGAVTMIWRTKEGQPNSGQKVVIDPAQIQSLSFRLDRQGDAVTGSYSLDQKKWTTLKTVKVSSKNPLLSGLAVCSGNVKQKVDVTFDKFAQGAR